MCRCILAKDFYVIAPDLRGHGDSAHTDSYGFADYASDVEELMTGKGPYTLVGHSMGGYVGLELASRAVRPGRPGSG